MKYLVSKSIKQRIREADKQVSASFMVALDAKVEALIIRAIRNSNGHKRLTNVELMV